MIECDIGLIILVRDVEMYQLGAYFQTTLSFQILIYPLLLSEYSE